MAPATKDEVGSVLYVSQEVEALHNTLEYPGHAKLETLLECYNQCATVILNNTVKKKQSKDMDRIFYWLRCQT